MVAPSPDPPTPAALPEHIEQTIRAIAELHSEHRSRASPAEKALQRCIIVVGSPAFLVVLTVLLIGWVGGNLLAPRLGYAPIDPAPFPWLDGVVGVAALYTTVIILAGQRRENELDGLREQLTLELAIVSEQKSAKAIQLLEEMRRDSAGLPDHTDQEAEDMSTPADTRSLMQALQDREAEARRSDPG